VFKTAETESAEGSNRYLYRNFSGGTLEPEDSYDA
jgi:pyrroloquinoline quinone biosynthesis protein E